MRFIAIVGAYGLNDWGSFASIISFFLTLYVMRVARTVKKYINRTTHVPYLIEQIHDFRTQLGVKLLTPGIKQNEFKKGASACLANLMSLRTKIPYKLKWSVWIAMRRVNNLNTNHHAELLHAKLEYIETATMNWLNEEEERGTK